MYYWDRIYFALKYNRWALVMSSLALAWGLLCLAELGWGLQMQQELEDQVIRLHVTAADNTQAGQEAKMAVGSAVEELLRPLLTPSETRQEACERLRSLLPRIEECARAAARGPVQVTLTRETFPTRGRDGYTLPAGQYETLRITLGQGEGHNWWGLLFPEWNPQSEESSWTQQEQSQELQIRFWLLEWWESWTADWFGETA